MIYFAYGPNRYLLSARVAELVADFTGEYGSDGVERYDGENITPQQLPELLQAISLFTPHRLIIIRGASQNKAVWDLLGDWVSKVPEEVQLVIVEYLPDKRTKTFKALSKAATVFAAEPLKEPALVAWLMDEMKRRGKVLSRKQAQLLVGRIGEDQSALSNELDKLIVHDEITEELIISLTQATPQASAFELLDAVMAGNPDKAKQIIDELKDSEDPYKLFGLLSSQVHTFALVVAASESKTPQAQIAKDSGAHPYVVGKMMNIARRKTWSQAREVVVIVAELDDKIKSSGTDPWLLLEASLMKVATQAT